MKRFTAAQARARLSELLDEADRGTAVAIERRGVRYLVRVEPPRTRTRRKASVIEVIDPAVERGDWSWSVDARGLRFRPAVV